MKKIIILFIIIFSVNIYAADWDTYTFGGISDTDYFLYFTDNFGGISDTDLFLYGDTATPINFEELKSVSGIIKSIREQYGIESVIRTGIIKEYNTIKSSSYTTLHKLLYSIKKD